MDFEAKEISCRNCKKAFLMKSIVQHVKKSECHTTYSEDQISSLITQSKQLSAAKKKIKDAERYKRKKIEIAKKYDKVKRAHKYQKGKTEIAEKYDKQKRAENYEEKKSEIAKKYQEKKSEIAKKYQENRVHHSLRYYKKRNSIAKRYNKEMRKKRYKKVMAKIAQNRK
jgi:hypothetical protein